MKELILIALFASGLVALGACSTREMATGAAAGAAGYAIGRDVED